MSLVGQAQAELVAGQAQAELVAGQVHRVTQE